MTEYRVIANLKGPRGFTGPMGLPGVNGVPADEAVAGYLGTEGSASRLELVSILTAFGMISVARFGAVGDGVTDDTEAIQAAIDFVEALGVNRYGRALYFPPGIYRVTTLYVHEDQLKLVGAGMQASMIVRDTIDENGVRYANPEYDMAQPEGRAMIEVEATGFSALDIGLKSKGADGSWPSGSASTVRDAALRLRTKASVVEGVTYRERSLDAHLENVYLSGWGYGAIVEGQGLTVRHSLVTLNRRSFTLDFPAVWRLSGTLHNNDGTCDFRTYVFENNRTQANSEPFVTNTGQFAEKIQTLVIDGWVGDIGGEIFEGNLSNGVIRNFVNQQGQQTPIIRLTNGVIRNPIIEHGTIQGLGSSDTDIAANYPSIGIQLMGDATLEGGRIAGVDFIRCGQYGMLFMGSVQDTFFEDLYFENCGHAVTGARGAIRFEAAGARVRGKGIRLRDTGSTAFTVFNFASSLATGFGSYVFDNVARVGSQTSREGGLGPIFDHGGVINGLASAAPTTGTWRAGDRVYRVNGPSGGVAGWVCTATGTPGTWATIAG